MTFIVLVKINYAKCFCNTKAGLGEMFQLYGIELLYITNMNYSRSGV